MLDLVWLGKAPSSSTFVFELLGYDVGYYENEYGHFSSIFHEVIPGKIEGLRGAYEQLNASLLLPTSATASDLLKKREQLLTQGKDLETVGHFETIQIHAVREIN